MPKNYKRCDKCNGTGYLFGKADCTNCKKHNNSICYLCENISQFVDCNTCKSTGIVNLKTPVYE